MDTALPGDPQKSPAMGPEFDFTAPAVIEAESSLRILARGLKGELELLLADFGADRDYAGLQKYLSDTMPAIYRGYDAFVAAVVATGPERITCSKGCSATRGRSSSPISR